MLKSVEQSIMHSCNSIMRVKLDTLIRHELHGLCIRVLESICALMLFQATVPEYSDGNIVPFSIVSYYDGISRSCHQASMVPQCYSPYVTLGSRVPYGERVIIILDYHG